MFLSICKIALIVAIRSFKYGISYVMAFFAVTGQSIVIFDGHCCQFWTDQVFGDRHGHLKGLHVFDVR